MVRRKIQASSPDEMRIEYPIDGRLPNWYFRMRETSNNAWTVEGSDIWGRKVSRCGADPDELLEACVEDARHIGSHLNQVSQ